MSVLNMRERQRQLRENLVLEQAYALLLEKGYERMTMDKVAGRVGITKMTLYTHFASKEALAVALIVQRMRVLYTDLLRLAHTDQPAQERLRAMLQHTLVHHMEKWNAQLAIEHRIVNASASFQDIDGQMAELWTEVVDVCKLENAVRKDLATAVIVQIVRRLYILGFEELLAKHTASMEDITLAVVSIIWSGIKDS